LGWQLAVGCCNYSGFNSFLITNPTKMDCVIIFGVERMRIVITIFLYIVLFGMMQAALIITAFLMGFASGGDHFRQELSLYVLFSLLNVALFIVFLKFISLFKRPIIIGSSILTIALWVAFYAVFYS